MVMLTLGQLCWLQLRAGSATRAIWGEVTRQMAAAHPPRPTPATGQETNGNVWLQLAGYARTNPIVDRSLFFFYFQTTYALYPRRIYAARVDQVIISGRDIMHAQFQPDPEWLKAHQVRYVATFGNGNRGGTPPQWEPLPEANVEFPANLGRKP